SLASVPNWMDGLATPVPSPEWLLVAPGVWLMLLMAVATSLVLRYTVFGRYVFAIGSNELTARLCGLNVPALKISIYVTNGLFIGLAGVYQFAKLKVGNPTSGVGLELKVIAAVVIGGASLNGGRGTVLGTLSGAILMQTIASGCTQLGLRNPVQDIILGVIIVAAVIVDQFRQRRVEAAN
ncbi:MAG TPA: ABC transporter permease, partial [Lacipirellulaceae bacterium]|nr:ABC transporter permease [Lacipirellulaceae bacterium]